MADEEDVVNLYPGECLQEGDGFSFPKFKEKSERIYKECFDFIDHDKNGVIDKAELIKVMRGIGLNPSKKDAEELIASVAETGEIQNFSDVKGTVWSRPFLVSIRLRKTKSLIFIKLHCV
ncbi:calmodulin-like protein [Crassostrea angulata]|uniref:calmodulin-like protein n=1 Tax=Magallana angulata TaxID=2784310 RepID=UPI0022B11B1E|nr:calmodulin-like protein [Crassostrea angulata]